MRVGVIGLGFVGSSMHKSFLLNNVDVVGYDKYKNGGIGSIDDMLNTEILFLCLPTQFDTKLNTYDKSAIYETCMWLADHKYAGLVVIKSTVECGTTEELAAKYTLNFVHNPEFLTARTAFEDFHNQKHIVLGKANNVDNKLFMILNEFYQKYYPNAKISLCCADESESMKLFCNCFYSVKIQFFNELYLLCQKMGISYDNVKDMMLRNNWINPQHTTVPGPDGQLSYGGLCFPKDTNALLQLMKSKGTPHSVLEACINERNEMRDDHDNVK
jgi:UDPglucose 6-dehydrogenase